MYFTSKSWQFSDDIHTPPGSNNISLPPYQLLNILSSIPLPTSVAPSRPMLLSFLSESVSICICHPHTHLRVINRCVRMQNNWCSLGRDWMGLSGAFNQCIFCLSLPASTTHYSLINLWALWGCNVFAGGGGIGSGCARGGGSCDRGSSCIIKHYTLGRTRYQGLSDGVSSALWRRRRHDYSAQDKKGLLSVVHKSTLQLY